MFKKLPNSQSGFAPIIIVLLLLGGVVAGTALVQTGTRFIPFADCNPGIDNDCNSGGGSEDDPGEKEAQQKQEQQDLEKGAREAGKSLEDYKVDDCKANPGKSGCDEIIKRDQEKRTGTTEGSSGSGDKNGKDCQPVTYCEDGQEIEKRCYEDGTAKFDKKPYKSSKEGGVCVNDKDENLADGTVVGSPEGGNLGKNPNISATVSKQGDQGCDTFTYCGPNKTKVRKVQIFDSEKNACGEAKEVEGTETCDKPGEVLAGVKDDDKLAKLAEYAAKNQQIQDDKIQLDAVRKQLSVDGYVYDADKSLEDNKFECKQGGTRSVESCERNMEILNSIVEAQKKLDEIRAHSDNCIVTFDDATCTTASAAHRVAVAAARAAVVNGMLASDNPATGVCVKADFGNTKNLIEASPGQTSGGSSRVFMCRKSSGDKSLVLRVRDASGNLVDVSTADKQRLGWKEGAKTYHEIPPEFQVNVKNANCLASGICGTPIPGQSTAQPTKTPSVAPKISPTPLITPKLTPRPTSTKTPFKPTLK